MVFKLSKKIGAAIIGLGMCVLFCSGCVNDLADPTLVMTDEIGIFEELDIKGKVRATIDDITEDIEDISSNNNIIENTLKSSELGNIGDGDFQGDKQKSDAEVVKDIQRPDVEVIKESKPEDYLKYGGYAYSLLNDTDKKVYKEIYTVINEHKNKCDLSTVNQDDISKIFQYVMCDNPQLFMVEMYNLKTYERNGMAFKAEFEPVYIMTQDEVKNYLDISRAYLEKCKTYLPSNASDYEKAKCAYEFIVNNTSYSIEAKLDQTMCSVTAYNESVCQGYAKTYQYLLNEMGVFATLVTGVMNNGENHAWNLVEIDGEYYYVDVTHGDPINGGSSNLGVNYDYLCITTEELLKTRSIDDLLEVPNCISNDSNYYVKEKLCFESYDREKLHAIFDEAYLLGKDKVEIRAINSSVYKEILHNLINNDEMFDFINDGTKQVNYLEDYDMNTLKVWL